MKESSLLMVDAIINLVLGIGLICFPTTLIHFIGIPIADSAFYPSILGAVLFGIGIALLVERFQTRTGISGLGLGGAICINVCGAGVLVIWLLQGGLELPLHGFIVLWAVALAVFGISILELIYYKQNRAS